MKVTLRLFGAFRNYGTGSELELDLAEGATISDLRLMLAREVGNVKLADDSAFAVNGAILQGSVKLSHGSIVAVLPPVCGG